MQWVKTFFFQITQLKRRWIGLIVGSLCWLIWMLVGWWATLGLIVLAALGYIVGRIFEEHKTWKEIVEKLLSERFME